MRSIKKKILQYIQINILPFFLYLYIKFVYFTSKKNFHYPQAMDDESFILAFWHGDLIMQPINYRNFKKNGIFKGIISEHRDGRVVANLYEYFGADKDASGSSTRGGAKALIAAIKSLKNGIDIAITPDGPKGPIYTIADGIVMLSQKTNAKILCFSSTPSKYWRFNSWDKFVLPKPFGTIDFYVSEPISVEGLSKEEAKEKIKSNMRYLDE
jgi:lysophospholipid acyltransferase (LPLAT)-like uncharacterized protein